MKARNNYVFQEDDDDTELFKDLPEDYDNFDVELEEDDLIISSDLSTRQSKFKKLSIINAGILGGWILFIILSLRIFFPLLGFYSITGRLMVAFPFALELFLNCAFACVGFIFMRHTMSGHVLAAIYLFINCIYNVVIMWYVPSQLKSFFFEPWGEVNEDWQWMWTTLQTYMAFSIIAVIVQIVLAVLIVYRLRISPVITIYANDDKIDRKSRGVIAVQFGIVLVAIASFVLLLTSFIALMMVVPDWNPPEVNLALPWPSNEYTVQDQNSATGLRLALPADRMPPIKGGGSWNMQYWNELDGFSVMSPLLVKFSELSSLGLIPWDNITSYSAANATTVIINTKTGEKIPHWAEVDAHDPIDPLLLIQPAVPLDWATRYVVGIRNLVTKSGNLIEASDAFKKLRDDDTDKTPEWRHFDESVFPILANSGFARSRLQLAWEFTTMSRDICLGRAETIRDDALNRIDEVTYKIHLIEEDACEGNTTDVMARTIYGEINAPYYLASPTRGSIFPRADGKRVTKLQPLFTKKVQFLIRVPCSLKLSQKPAEMILQYGHGLFGSRSEGMTRHLRRISNNYNYVLVAMDWYGMSKHDVPVVAKWLMSDMSNFASLPEMTTQGFVFKSLMLRVMKGILAKDQALYVGEVPLLSQNTPVGYYGNSQGGIIGAAYVASSRDLKRGVLGVPGGPYSVLLPRSVDFTRYQKLLSYQFYTWTHQLYVIALMQPLWDQGEPAGWMSSINNPPPGMSQKQILLQMAFGDAQVSYLGAEIMARAYNASNAGPQVRSIFGVPEHNGDFYGSGIAQWRYENVPWEPFNNTAPLKIYDTHECPRREPEAQNQIRDFLKEGVIRQYCTNGPCVREKCPEKY